MKKIIETTITTKSGECYDCVLIVVFNNYFLVVDYLTCVSNVELSTYGFDEEGFEETYIEFMNRVMGVA